MGADFYAPSEGVDLWYTDATNHSIGINRYTADLSGELSVTVDASGWTNGTYVIAGRGIRTDITGAVAITISDATSSSRARTIEVKELNNSTLHSFLKSWASSK